jgi:hypothetical protein
MSDVDDILRAQTTEPYIVIQLGEDVPTPDGSYKPVILSSGNGMDPVEAISVVMEIATQIVQGNAQVLCGTHNVSREEILHARREPPYGG